MKIAFQPIRQYLERLDVLKDLRPEEIALLFRSVKPKEYPPGTFLFTPDDPGERLLVLKVGRVDVYRITAAGKRLVVRRLAPTTIFGEMGLLGQSLQGCFAEVVEESLVCAVNRNEILEVLRQHPDVAIRLLEVVGKRVGLLEERLEQALFSSVKVRLASFLLTNMDPLSGVVANYTHEDIGDTIGALRQTVTETLRLMRNEGLVEVMRKRIRVANGEKLEKMVQDETTFCQT